MEKKSFVVILIILALTFAACTVLRYYRAPVGREVTLANLPLIKGDWSGQADEISSDVREILSADQLFSASYSGPAGGKVQLFVDYFSPENTAGAIHSPRNCLPGSGWVIVGSQPRMIESSGRRIRGTRMNLSLGSSRAVMDYWYITRYGETANDYMLKFNTMISSLTLRPTDKAFVRFVAAQDSAGIAAMEDFERLFIGDIYGHLPF